MHSSKGSLIRIIWRDHLKLYKTLLARAFMCMLIAAIATTAFPYLLKPSFDYIFQNNSMMNLLFWGIAILSSFLIKGLASYGETFFMTYVGQKIVFDIQMRLFTHLVRADLGFFNNSSSGDLLSRFSNDVTLLRNSISNTISGFGKDILTFIFLVGLMVYRDSVLAVFACIVFPFALGPIILLGRKMKKIVNHTQNNLGSFSGHLSQVFQGIRVIKAYCAEELEIARIQGKMNSLMRLIVKSIKIKAILHPISECITGIAIICVLIYGGSQVMSGAKTIGDLISFLGALLISYEPIRKMIQLSANINEGLAAAERIFCLINVKPSIQNASKGLKLANPVDTIEFKDVTSQYSPDKQILKDISFKVNKGQTIAFVGRSGAGKSTLLNLIPRFYDVSDGSILFNGIDIREIDLFNLREQISIVTQENILFDASFYDNIAYGKRNATREEIVAAARSALALEFIEETEDGFDTLIGENGIRISGGQRQRIAIARAMLKNAPILLLDEATSALDADAEKSVQQALETLMKNRTTIIVTHRLTSLKKVNTIYVLDDGIIKEYGAHDELLAQDGLYKTLWTTCEK
ncbi:MAG: ABC transporter ATP-binding protein/permease [Holosporales bacterium]|nr:ABC transporter ATP-binding protein/permease [Holosporales bacterium]